ncbi:MAG: glycosyltransferase family 4 protein [Oscillochloridaceae bacterium]|nr:glycosyltransferase family 4 protein [Chloroflexaceae bacterium]MDW8388718.1 glycosyltransferase family 4 protein [Oscillochloridaceae bacterium]
MRILILAHFYPPEMGGPPARLHSLARWLAAFGHQVTVITGFPNYPTGVVAEEYRGKLRAIERLDGVDVLRTWVYASSFRTSWRRLANNLSFAGSAIVAGLTSGRSYDVILASSPPLFVGLAGWFLARTLRIPFVFDVRDLWPEVVIEAGELAPNAPLARALAALARFLYRGADHITPVTERKRTKLIAAGVPPEKLTVVNNGADLDRVPVNLNGYKRSELGLDDKFVVLYAGLIGIAQGVEIAVHAADRLREHNDVHFLIVGDGVRKPELVAEAKRLSLSNVTVLPRQPRESIPAFLRAADACLVPLVNASLDDAVPSKLLEAWGHGCPVILAAGGEAADLVRRSGGGVVVSPNDPGQLAEAVLALKRDRTRLADYARSGRAFVAKHFDREALARRMEQVLQQVVADRAAH